MDYDLNSVFTSLADPTRLRLLQVLAEQTPDSCLCVCALAGRLGVSQPAVSQHLRVLRGLGLVRAERCGMRVHYRLDPVRLKELQTGVQAFLDSLTHPPEASNGCNCGAQDGACTSDSQ